MRPYHATQDQVQRFMIERETLRLRYKCWDCVHVHPASGKCSLEYPNQALMDADAFLEDEGQFVFCKYFELA